MAILKFDGKALKLKRSIAIAAACGALTLGVALPAQATAERYIGVYNTQTDCKLAGSKWLASSKYVLSYRCTPFYSAGRGGYALYVTNTLW